MTANMFLPSDEDLNKMSMKLCGAPFNMLPTPNEKARVMELTIMGLQSADINGIVCELERIQEANDKFQETMLGHLEWLSTIGEWFEKSKLWDAECRVVGN